ncbi:MAG: pyridoxamine 5'-phosphate oxidase family protein [Bacteroidia bacterium]
MEKDKRNALTKSTEVFLADNKIASVCFVTGQGIPYCITCFYYFDKTIPALVFKSSRGTTHGDLIKEGAVISGTILPDKVDFLNIKGIQFSGVLMNESDIEMNGLKNKYTKKYLIGSAIPGYIWAVRLTFIKFTDNSLGFGNKSIWQADRSLTENE